MALALAYPHRRFRAVYDGRLIATRRHPDAPLNRLVEALATVVIASPQPVFAQKSD